MNARRRILQNTSKGGWNYRVMKHLSPRGEIYYAIHEVYYDKKDQVRGYSRAMDPFGETEYQLCRDVQAMQRAFTRPVLDYDRLEREAAKRRKRRVDAPEEIKVYTPRTPSMKIRVKDPPKKG